MQSVHRSHSEISANATAGAAGQVRLAVDTLRVTGGSLITVSGDTGGTVQIQGQTPGDRVHDMRIEDGARITADATGAGAAGQIQVRADTLQVTGQGQIRSTTQGAGPGGDIDIQAGQMIVTGQAAVITKATATGSTRHIDITADTLSVEQGRIGSANKGQGDGGRIAIDVKQTFVVRDGGRVVATEQNEEGRGKGGEQDTIVELKAIDFYEFSWDIPGFVQKVTFA
jgi:hypothetical protein